VGYYVATDQVVVRNGPDGAALAWVSDPDRDGLRVRRGEYLYWNHDMRMMTGIVEGATVFATAEDAEAGAFLAATLDPELAGHLHVVGEDLVLKREKYNIAERARRQAEYKKVQDYRFRLGSKEDGGI
jgi:hypothetical protein